jgi:fibronectin type 3 domain-containing protein
VLVTDANDTARDRAEAKLKKEEQRSADAAQVRAEQAANPQAVDDKTARLNAQRTANEGAGAATLRPPDGGHARKRSRKRPPKLIANPDEVLGG